MRKNGYFSSLVLVLIISCSFSCTRLLGLESRVWSILDDKANQPPDFINTPVIEINNNIPEILDSNYINDLSGFTLIAGLDGGFGYTNGTSDVARISGGGGLAYDPQIEVFYSSHGQLLRRITSQGVITDIAGGNLQSGNYLDGTQSSAKFLQIYDVVFNPLDKSIYAIDYTTIRKVTSQGVVTTYAGDKNSFGGFQNGVSSTARFNALKGAVLDSLGNLYVSDMSNHKIRKISTTGIVSTFAGDSEGYTDHSNPALAQFRYPSSLAIDSNDNIYVVDAGNAAIRKITPAGVVTTLAGGSGGSGLIDGTGTGALFSFNVLQSSASLTIDENNNLYVVDQFLKNTVRKITPQGVVTTIANNSLVTFNNSSTILVLQSLKFKENKLYFSDIDYIGYLELTNNTVYTLTGKPNRKGLTLGAMGVGQLYSPNYLHVDGGEIFISQNYPLNASMDWPLSLRKIQISTGETQELGGSIDRGYVDGTVASAKFDGIGAIIRLNNGDGVVADSDALRKINQSDLSVSTWVANGQNGLTDNITDGSAAASRFSGQTYGITKAFDNSLIITDLYNNVIRSVSPMGVTSTIAGDVNDAGSGNPSVDGIGSAADIRGALKIATDSNGDFVFIQNSCVRKLNHTTFEVTTLAGHCEIADYVNALGLNARFDGLRSLAIDSLNNIYVVENQNTISSLNRCNIRKISSAGVVTNFAGDSSDCNLSVPDNDIANVRFSNIRDIVVNASNELIINDTSNFIKINLTNNQVNNIGYIDYLGSLSFDGPMTVDSSGFIYVSQAAGIYKLNLTTISSVLYAGVYSYGSYFYNTSQDGITNQNHLEASALISDNLGNVYFANGVNSFSSSVINSGSRAFSIRQIATNQTVSTISGPTGGAGFTDGSLTDARFNGISCLFKDTTENIFVCDQLNHLIRKVSPAGLVTTVVGHVGFNDYTNSVAATANITAPKDLVVNSLGEVFFLESESYAIRKVDTSGNTSTYAGSVTTQADVAGNLTTARFVNPSKLAIDSNDNIYVYDGRGVIKKINNVTQEVSVYLRTGKDIKDIQVDNNKLYMLFENSVWKKDL